MSSINLFAWDPAFRTCRVSMSIQRLIQLIIYSLPNSSLVFKTGLMTTNFWRPVQQHCQFLRIRLWNFTDVHSWRSQLRTFAMWCLHASALCGKCMRGVTKSLPFSPHTSVLCDVLCVSGVKHTLYWSWNQASQPLGSQSVSPMPCRSMRAEVLPMMQRAFCRQRRKSFHPYKSQRYLTSGSQFVVLTQAPSVAIVCA